VALSFYSITSEKLEDITQSVKAESEENAESGINIFWWVAFLVSLGIWYGLIEAAIWAWHIIMGGFS
jgi:hypothetical protein